MKNQDTCHIIIEFISSYLYHYIYLKRKYYFVKHIILKFLIWLIRNDYRYTHSNPTWWEKGYWSWYNTVEERQKFFSACEHRENLRKIVISQNLQQSKPWTRICVFIFVLLFGNRSLRYFVTKNLEKKFYNTSSKWTKHCRILIEM